MLPITYTWQATGQSPLMHASDHLSDVVAWTWDTSGPQTITVTARHDDYAVRDTHLITSYSPPTVDWVANPTVGFDPLTVVFTATETNTLPFDPLLAYLWRFGDGETSASPNPTHTYAAPGSYTVTLTVSNTVGNDTLTRPNYVTVYQPVQAGFTAASRQGFAPFTIHLTSTSSGPVATGEWTWGDGETSALEHPTHTYTTPGTYTVSLAVRAAAESAIWPGGTDILTHTNYITVYEPVQASFTVQPTWGYAPLSVVLSNTSRGDYTTSLWNFGDGVSSTLHSPIYTYTTAGTYTATPAVRGPGGSDTEARQITVYQRVYLPLISRY
jgi:PKD repeat protein